MKRLRPEDTTLHISTVHKDVKVQEDNSSLNIVNYDSSSTNEVSRSYYNSLNHLFYDTSYHNSSSVGGFAGNYSVYDDYLYLNNIQPQHRNKFFTKGILLDVSASLYGDRIESGSFKLSNQYASNATVWLVDDGQGNLYASGSNVKVSQSSDTSISSSENYIGNIFYEDGLVVISETGSFKTTHSWTGSLDSASIEFRAETSVITRQISCKIKKDEYNQTMNKTILNESSSVGTIELPAYSYYNLKNIPYPEGRIKVNRNDYITYEYRNFENFTIGKRYLNKYFTPYISKIGLYNQNQELIMIASFPTPIKKSKEMDMTIIVKYDF